MKRPRSIAVLGLLAACAAGQTGADDAAARQAIAPDALLKTPVAGLERTEASAEVVPIKGEPFGSALRVKIGGPAPDSNVTQLTIRNAIPVRKGDALLASLYVRGAAAGGKSPAQTMLLFERATAPWTKSVTRGVSSLSKPEAWKRVSVPFAAAGDYAPGEAMLSLRFAFGAQTIEIGGLSLLDYGSAVTAESLETLAASQNPLGSVTATVHPGERRQTMLGMGGNFCQPRYGATEPEDAVGRYNLAHLHVAHARIGIPLNAWAPERGPARDEGPAHAALLQMREMARRKIPITGSVWEGPAWLLGGRREQSGRTLPPDRYGDCIEAIAQFLVAARDRYGATVDTFSFNEADYGVNFKFTPAQIDAFIRQAGPRFQQLGLKTKFLVGDTANGSNFVDYVPALLADRQIQPYLGPLAFHCWDALSAPDARYAQIAEIGRKAGKPVWCTEAGHDAQLWQKQNPWQSWDNALGTAIAYEKTVRLTDASLMDYWTYQDNYPLVSKDGSKPYPVFAVMKQMEAVLSPKAVIAAITCGSEDLRAVASIGPRPSQAAVLLINPIGRGSVTLAGLPPGSEAAIEESTAEAQGRRRTAAVDAGGRLTVPLPARSVVTVAIGAQ
ncbi:MAG TPA: hypothetical protein VKT77_12755 [Chthonomonadaceae bacterium]|nr:hypothetical protein [Chthonomonadaceae bacterium]